MVQLTAFVVKDCRNVDVIGELFEELSKLDMSRESAGTRTVAKFLDELADNCPHEMLESIDTLLPQLEEDAYPMRNAVLAIIGKVVARCLSDNSSDRQTREMREQLLDILEEHILDVTTFTRSKVLQVWTKLCEEGLIPKDRLSSLIEAVVGRLRDKSVYVRKNAVLFLTAFLNRNPFSAKIELDRLRVTYEVEFNKLKAMMEKKGLSLEESELAEEEESKEEIWESLEDKITEYWMEISATSASANETDDDDVVNDTMLSEGNDIKVMAKRFCELIKEEKFGSALRLMKKLKDQFPTHSLFVENSEVENDSENSNQSGPPLPRTVGLAKKLFLADFSSAKKLSLDNEIVHKMAQEAVQSQVQTQPQSPSQCPAENHSQMNGEESTTVDNNADESIDELIKLQQIVVKFLKAAVKFAEQLKIAIPLICSLLYSSSVTDAQEAIDFFVTAYQFGVQGAIIGIRQMLVLIFSRDKNVRDAVLAAYKEVYLNSPKYADMTYRQRAVAIVRSLIVLVRGASLGERLSLEELLKKLFETGDLQKEHIQVLFEFYTKRSAGISDADSVAAAQLLAMLAGHNKELIRGNIDTFVQVGLTERCHDMQLVQNTCTALQRAVSDNTKIEDAEPCYRFEARHPMFVRLQDILLSNFNQVDKVHWMTVASEAVRVIYTLADHPDAICENLVRQFMRELLPLIKSVMSKSPNKSKGSSAPCGSPVLDKQNPTAEHLARFISFVGDVAFNQLVHMESSVTTEIKIRKYLKDKESQRRKSSSVTRHSKSNGEVDAIEEEMGLTGASAVEDMESEAIARICNDEIVMRKC